MILFGGGADPCPRSTRLAYTRSDGHGRPTCHAKSLNPEIGLPLIDSSLANKEEK